MTASSTRCRAGTALCRPGHGAPRRVLLVNHPFHPPRNRRERHLDEEARVVDALGQRRRQHDWRAGVMTHPLTSSQWSCFVFAGLEAGALKPWVNTVSDIRPEPDFCGEQRFNLEPTQLPP